MEKIDYIIVGGGYAGVFFAHQLLKNNKTFKLFFDGKISGSHISAGVCNPVILKRFNTFWKSKEQMEYLKTIFSEIEKYTGKNYLIDEPVARIFHNEDEKKQWAKNSQKDDLKDYLNNKFINLNSVENPYEAGIVDKSCRIDVESFFNDFFDYLEQNGNLIKSPFNYQSLDSVNSRYEDIRFDKIVFCEGIGIKNNPFFPGIPVLPNKGHCLEISIDNEIDPYIIKKKHFLFSLSNGGYYYGGTYDRFDMTDNINEKSVSELENGFKEFYKNAFEIREIRTAFRATVADRKPILGRHSQYPNLYIFNGLGTRGVLNGSYFSKELFDFIENDAALGLEVDVKRFFIE